MRKSRPNTYETTDFTSLILALFSVAKISVEWENCHPQHVSLDHTDTGQEPGYQGFPVGLPPTRNFENITKNFCQLDNITQKFMLKNDRHRKQGLSVRSVSKANNIHKVMFDVMNFF